MTLFQLLDLAILEASILQTFNLCELIKFLFTLRLSFLYLN